MTQYAIVQHSGFGYGGNPQFLRGLEMRSVTPKQAEDVRNAGGLVFDDYLSADEYCEAEMYPPTVLGLIPNAPGAFLRRKVDGLSIYVPRTPVTTG